MAKSTIRTYKKSVWKSFSRFIRLRDCLKTTGTIQRGRCITCNVLGPFKGVQAGHFVPGRTDSILFDEEGVHLQCVRCNKWLGGNFAKYYEVMLDMYGQEKVNELIAKKNQDKKFTMEELKALKRDFDERAEAMLKNY
jgi:hypothetical protein